MSNFNLEVDPTRSPIGNWVWCEITTDVPVTGVDYQFNSHGTPLIALNQIPHPNFPDVFKTNLLSDLGASISDVSMPLPTGTYKIAEYEFPQGTTDITVTGSFAGPPPTFSDYTASPATLSIPEPNSLIIVIAALMWWGFRGKNKSLSGKDL